MSYQIALDGPSGAGKSTVARAVAQRLNILYLDTGAMYRAVGLYYHRLNADFTSAAQVSAALPDCNVEITFVNGQQRVLLNGEDVSDEIRMHYVSALASGISAQPCVRQYLVKRQQQIAGQTSCILDGRDICSCVLPHAQYKFFLTASPQVRAARRAAELRQKGQPADEEQICKDIIKRDYDDSHRAVSPLAQAPDAILIDSTCMTAQQVTDYIVSFIKE